MSYDKSAVMKLAWARAKQNLWSARADKSHLRVFFQKALVVAWKDEKTKPVTVRSTRSADEILRDIRVLESKDKLRGADWIELDKLKSELRSLSK